MEASNKKTYIKTNLRDIKIEKVNSQALKVQKYFKNQKPYNGEDLYTDDLFPPNFSSIVGLDSNGNKKDAFFKYNDEKFDEQEIKWLRPAEIFHGKFAVFEGKIQSDDTVQGDLSDCYFISVLSAFAKYPQLIIQNFRHLKVQNNGYYEVCLRIDGIWKVVILDDFFPCNNKGIPIFTKPNGSEIWVMLLQKAWAKVNGGYCFIEFGYGLESFNCLSNFVVDRFYLGKNDPKEEIYKNAEIFTEIHNELFSPQNIKINSDEELNNRIWKKLYTSIKNSAIIVTISTLNENNEMEALKPNGIIVGHEYTILNMHESDIQGNLVRLLEIRNPHGGNEFNGKWSDKSSEWTEETRKIFNNFQDVDQGTFFMSFEDFMDNFSSFEICHILDPLCSKTYQIQKGYENKVIAYDFNIELDSIVAFTSFIKSRRFHKKIPLNPSQKIEFVLVRLTNENEFELVRKCIMYYAYEQTWMFNLRKGVYKVFLKFDMNDKFNYDKVRKINFNVTCNNFFFLNLSGEDYEKTVFSHDFTDNFKLTTDNYLKIANSHINSNCDIDYDYVFKNLKINFSIFSDSVDQRQTYMEYYEQVYPNFIHLLKKLEPMECYEKDNQTKSFDVSFIYDENGTKYYVGEVIISGMNIIRTGRVAIHDMSRMNSEDEFFVSYFNNGVHEGSTIEFSNDTFLEYYFKDGKINGDGKIFYRNGNMKLVVYRDSEIIEENILHTETHKYSEEFNTMFLPKPIEIENVSSE